MIFGTRNREKLTLGSAVDELSGVHSLGGDDGSLDGLVLVGVAEGDDGEGGTTSGVVDDVLDDALDVAVTLGIVQRTQLGGSLAVLVVRFEDTAGSLTLNTDTTSHFVLIP